MYVHVYIHNTKESLALNLEIGKTNWHSTVIADNGDSALRLVIYGLGVNHLADPTQSWSAIFMFCLENGRWQAATTLVSRPTSGCHSILTFPARIKWLPEVGLGMRLGSNVQ